MANCIPGASDEIPTTSTSRCALFLKLWQSCQSGSYLSYFVVLAVNVAVAGFLLASCPSSNPFLFFGLSLAGFGSGAVAVFLKDRRVASGHARSACGYAIVNWFQCMLSLVQFHVHACSSSDLVKLFVRSARWVLYLICLCWMQSLIAGRLRLLERASHQKYRSQCVRRLTWTQLLGVAVASLAYCIGDLLQSIQAELGPSMAAEGVGDVALMWTWLCSLTASMVAICSLVQSLLQLHMVLVTAKLQDTATSAKSFLRRARRFAALQVMGVSFSLVLTSLSLASFLWNSISEDDSPVAWALQALDSFGNAATVLLLSGSHRLPALSQRMSCHVRPVQHRAVPAKETESGMLLRGYENMDLRLLQFYHEDLPSVQDWTYVPKEHRTRDVVRRVIIPFTSKEETAYAVSALNRDGAQRPAVMDLLAAVISDALGESCFNLVAQLLEDDCDVLAGILARSSRLDDRYWICAFAVNQHMSICHSNPYDRDPLTTELHPVCNCKCVNISDPDGHSAPSEINKFDEMMSHLANTGGCRQVIAVDRSFDLFSRAWCVAEIAEGRRLHMSQSLKLASKAIIQQRARSLGKLDVRNMRASSETDKELILNKIKNQRSKNIDDFNVELQSLIFDPESGLMATWHAMDSLQQMGEVGRLIRWGLADAGTGKVWRAWETSE